MIGRTYYEYALMTDQNKRKLMVGSTVKFRIGDAVNIDLEKLIQIPNCDLTIVGKIYDFSDSGDEENKFAVIKIDGAVEYVVVPTLKVDPL